MFNFGGTHRNVFGSGCMVEHSHQEYARVSISPQLVNADYFLSFLKKIIAIPQCEVVLPPFILWSCNLHSLTVVWTLPSLQHSICLFLKLSSSWITSVSCFFSVLPWLTSLLTWQFWSLSLLKFFPWLLQSPIQYDFSVYSPPLPHRLPALNSLVR